MALDAAAKHCAFQDVEDGKQRCGAVKGPVVRLSDGMPGSERLVGTGLLQSRDLRFFFDTFSAKAESWERLKVRTRYGCRRCSFQIRCTERSEMPVRTAAAWPVQCVTSSGGSEKISASTFATVRAECGGVRAGRVLSRSRASTSSLAKHCFKRQTAGRMTPACRATPCTLNRSDESGTMRARRMCLRGQDRSLAIADSANLVASSRSAQAVWAIAQTRMHQALREPSDRVSALAIRRKDTLSVGSDRGSERGCRSKAFILNRITSVSKCS